MNRMFGRLWPLLACLWLAAAGAGATSGTGSHANHAPKPLFPGTYSLTWAALKRGCSVSGAVGTLASRAPLPAFDVEKRENGFSILFRTGLCGATLLRRRRRRRRRTRSCLAGRLAFRTNKATQLPVKVPTLPTSHSVTSLAAAAVEVRACPQVTVAHHGGGDSGWGTPGPVCGNSGPVFLNTTRDDKREHHCQGLGCPTVNPLQRWVVRLPPWAPPGATLPGRLLTLEVRGSYGTDGAGVATDSTGLAVTFGMWHVACGMSTQRCTAVALNDDCPPHVTPPFRPAPVPHPSSPPAVCGPLGDPMQDPAGGAHQLQRHLQPLLLHSGRPCRCLAAGGAARQPLPAASTGEGQMGAAVVRLVAKAGVAQM